MTDVVDLYLQCRDFEKAVALSGLPMFDAHVKLLRSGVLSINDKIVYSSEAGRLGAEAELLFSELVPGAADANAYIRRNNPMFDFYYGDLKVDVKYSSCRKHKNETFWRCSNVKEAEFVVMFGERSPKAKLTNAYIFLIPSMFIHGGTFHIAKAGERFYRFLTSKTDLPKKLEAYRRAMEGLTI